MRKSDLALFMGTGKKVRLIRRHPSESRLNGYILDMSNNLLLMHRFDDFEPDGYTICRIRDIVKLRHGPYEEWFDHMLRSEKLLSGLKLPHCINLSTVETAIRSIADFYEQMVIECEDEKGAIEDFYIGRLVNTQTRNIYFQDFDALGYWSKTPKSIKIAEITKIQFDTPYIKVFSKYTREGDPPVIPKDEA